MTITLLSSTDLSVEEYQFGDDGVVLNSDAVLPFFDVVSIQGLDNAPARSQTHDREGTDGGYVDAEWESIRTITIEGTIYTDILVHETYLDDLKANFAVGQGDQPFYFMTDAGLRVLYGKSLGIRYNRDRIRRIGSAEATIQILCEDPRIYSPGEIIGSTSLGSGDTNGRGYPKSYPFGYGGIATQNGFTIVLGGNRPAPGVITIVGPVVNPAVIYDQTGATFSFNIILTETDSITIDLATKAVLLNGTANARGYMTITGTWFMLRPGSNAFRFLGTQGVGSTEPELSVTTKSTWR